MLGRHRTSFDNLTIIIARTTTPSGKRENCGASKMITGKKLIPAIKLKEPDTYRPWTVIDCPFVVVRMQDILLEDGRAFNARYGEIRASGGLHQFLGCSCGVILSTIMSDEMIVRGVRPTDMWKPSRLCNRSITSRQMVIHMKEKKRQPKTR